MPKYRGTPRFYEILKEMEELHDRKNSNYSTADGKGNGDPLSNFRECERMGIPAYLGCLTRMGDKWARLMELAKGKPDRVGESLIDTLVDLEVYTIICQILYEEYIKNSTP